MATPIPDNRKKGSSSGSSSGGTSVGGGYTPPNTSETTTGIVTGNLSKDTGYTTATAIEQMNDQLSGYVPVLVLSDLTKEQNKYRDIQIEAEL